MKPLNAIRTATASAGLAMLATTASFADPTYHGSHDGAEGYARSVAFRHDNPVKIFVDVDTREKRPSDERFQQQTEQAMRHNLPGYVRLVNNPRQADMTVHVREQDFDLVFRVVDRDRKDDRYKRVNPRTGNHCGPLYKASYTVVKERAEVTAHYTVRVQTDGVGRDRERIVAKAGTYMTYGENLRAHTRCTAEPTNRFPNNRVVALFKNNSKANRAHMAQQVRSETAIDLGHELAEEIASNVNEYYASLAIRYAHGGYYGNPWKDRNNHKTAHNWWD
ncbi:hypothetical protein [Kordiimonas sp.]|uniref:hypothetical protein n=1 Tax=Kordiimonas sp. TaxID=1970157 RepID=UPI003A948D42